MTVCDSLIFQSQFVIQAFPQSTFDLSAKMTLLAAAMSISTQCHMIHNKNNETIPSISVSRMHDGI